MIVNDSGVADEQAGGRAICLSDELEKYLQDKTTQSHRALAGEIRMRLDTGRQADKQTQQEGQQ